MTDIHSNDTLSIRSAPATLATVKHGGCVQLATSERERFEACAHAQSYRGGNILTDRDADHPKLYADPLAQLAWKIWQAALSAQPSPGGQGDALLESLVARWRKDADEVGTSSNTLCQKIANCTMRHAAELQAVLAARQPVGEPVDAECEGCKGGIRYDAQGCICTTCGKRPKWYMAGRRIRVTERRKPWKHFGAPVPFEAECTWQMGDSIDYRLDGETTSRRLNNFHQHWEKVEVIR